MALLHASPGEVVDLQPLGAKLANSKTATLIKSDRLEVVRIVMTAGKEIAAHKAPDEIVVQCLEGKVEFTALGATRRLEAGQLLFLSAGEAHSLRCVEDASLLLTLRLGH